MRSVRVWSVRVWKVGGEMSRCDRTPPSAFRPSALPHSPGVTLIELLIMILIISILAALVLGVAAVAAETARQSPRPATSSSGCTRC